MKEIDTCKINNHGTNYLVWLSTMRLCSVLQLVVSCCGLCVWCRLRIDAIVRYILLAYKTFLEEVELVDVFPL